MFRETTNSRIKMIHSLSRSILERLQVLKLNTYVSILKSYSSTALYPNPRALGMV